MSAEMKKSRLDPELMPRRDWLGMASLWSAASAVLFAAFGILRLPKAAVLASPSKRFRALIPENLTPADVFIPPGRNTAIAQDQEGVYAISLVCTHLGCIVKPDAAGFECPCHGSRFSRDGMVTKGPAPQPLAWLKVTKSGNEVVVDEGTTVSSGTKVDA